MKSQLKADKSFLKHANLIGLGLLGRDRYPDVHRRRHRWRVRVEGLDRTRGHRADRRRRRARPLGALDRGSGREPDGRRSGPRGGPHRVDRRRQRRHVPRAPRRSGRRPGCLPGVPGRRAVGDADDEGDVPRVVPLGRVRDADAHRRDEQGQVRRLPRSVGERDLGARADGRRGGEGAADVARRAPAQEPDRRGPDADGDDHRADDRRDDVDQEDARAGARTDRRRAVRTRSGRGRGRQPLPRARASRATTKPPPDRPATGTSSAPAPRPCSPSRRRPRSRPTARSSSTRRRCRTARATRRRTARSSPTSWAWRSRT